MKQLQFRLPGPARLADEMIVDLFCGGGGASQGIERALGRSPDLCVNHSPLAIATHQANHPASRHALESVWAVDPRQATAGRPVGLLWASPDCTHFSRAKGGKPVKRRIRSLANVIVKWCRDVRPRVVLMENVPEFVTWGPLGQDNRPDKAHAGEYFARWKRSLERLGYLVEHRVLCAADFGAPTSRRRLLLVARRDGQAIQWPTPTHGKGLIPYRTAAECIDWSIPCPSIFDRKRALKPATLRRIARGVMKYVVNDADPFIVNLTHGVRTESAREPMRTVTAAHRGEKALVAPTLAHIGNGERQGQAARCMDARAPLGTVVAQGTKHALVAAFLAKHYGGVTGHRADRPLGTITGTDHHSPVAVHLTKFYGTSTGADARGPLPTITCDGQHIGLVAAFLAKYYGTAVGQAADTPLDTITGKDRFGLVTVSIEGETYAIVDIGMRMFQPHELAKAQGFHPGYVLLGNKSQQVHLIGNSVPPDLAEAMACANLVETTERIKEIA